MKICILGSGGREHALAHRLSLDPVVEQIYVVPGNPGMLTTPKVECIPATFEMTSGFVTLIKCLNVDLVIPGPEVPLCEGFADLMKGTSIPVLGPRKEAAKLEGSKAYSKLFMQEFDIPTADFKIFEKAEEACEFLKTRPWGGRLVIKASELQAGKGVVVSDNLEEQLLTVERFMQDPKYPVKSRTLVIEECLPGEELSLFALCDGEEILYLGEARDHKRLLDGDKGPNTGGMGCYTHSSMVDEELQKRLEELVLLPVIQGMKKRGHPFRGFLFAGVMMDGDDIQVLEYNVRLGDPETQTLLPLIKGDLAQTFLSAARGQLKASKSLIFREHAMASVHIVMASENYPGLDGHALSLGHRISCDDALSEHNVKDVSLFYAGVKKEKEYLVNSGGRVLGVTALAPTLAQAQVKAYENLKKVHFVGAQYRKDIAARELNQK
jgi:phosphoribosylamine---glycine ligase